MPCSCQHSKHPTVLETTPSPGMTWSASLLKHLPKRGLHKGKRRWHSYRPLLTYLWGLCHVLWPWGRCLQEMIFVKHLKWSLSTLFKILCQSPRLVNTCDLRIICVVNIANVWLIQNPPSSTWGSLVACFPSHVFHPKWSWSCSPKKDRKTWWSKYRALQDLGMPMIHIMDRGKKKSKYLWNHQHVHDAELYHAATLR